MCVAGVLRFVFSSKLLLGNEKGVHLIHCYVLPNQPRVHKTLGSVSCIFVQ